MLGRPGDVSAAAERLRHEGGRLSHTQASAAAPRRRRHIDRSSEGSSMQRAAIAVLVGLVWGGVAQADVRTDEKTQVKLEGMLGRMAGLFGGRAAREGVVSTVSVKRDRKM